MTSDELEALLLVVRNAGLEEHRVESELRVQQRHVAVDRGEEVDAAVPLGEVLLVHVEGARTAGAAEGPARRHLGDEESDVITGAGRRRGQGRWEEHRRWNRHNGMNAGGVRHCDGLADALVDG